MVAEDHILGYDKNILRSFRQNVLGIERVTTAAKAKFYNVL